MAEIERHCVVCGKSIETARIEIRPKIMTCSAECAEKNAAYARKQELKRWRRRKQKQG